MADSRVTLCSWFGWLAAHCPGKPPAAVAKSGDWSCSTEGAAWIRNDIHDAIRSVTPAASWHLDPVLHLTYYDAVGMARCQEYRDYIRSAPAALFGITDPNNSNRRYGLSEFLYGVRLRVNDPSTWDESLACFLRAAAHGSVIDLTSLHAAADYLMERDDPVGEWMSELLAGDRPETALAPAVMRFFDVDYAEELEAVK